MQAPTPLLESFEVFKETYKPSAPFALPEKIKSNAPQGSAEDFVQAQAFLYSYRGSTDTFHAYRREIERLLAWSWWVQKKSLKELTRVDMEAFVTFCHKPPLSWIGMVHVPRFLDVSGRRVPNPAWRPFVVQASKRGKRLGDVVSAKDYQLSQSSVRALFAILGSFFEALIQESYVAANPIAQIRQKSKFMRKGTHATSVRRLSPEQWRAVIETAAYQARQDPDQHERTLFIMHLLYGLYLRISELAATPRWTPKMGDFHRDTEGRWWFKTVGKGNKERIIAVSEDILDALRRYRTHLHLPALPAPGDNTPLILKTRGVGAITSTRAIRFIVQECFDQAIGRLRLAGQTEEADLLIDATVHWLRHTGISDDVMVRPREHVRDDAGHGSSAITDRYIDIELKERHASAQGKRVLPQS